MTGANQTLDVTPSTTANYGLTSEEAARRLVEYGPNEVAKPPKVSRLAILARQFTSSLILILVVAAVIAAVLGEVVDAIAISLVLILNGVLGYVQEWRTETALAALRKMLTSTARVVRDGRHQIIDARDLVPGDLVVLESGDKVPADLELATAVQLQLDESILTGESVPRAKSVGGEDARLFMGTSVVTGRAEGWVVATGAHTEFGQIADLTKSVGTKKTHLQVQLGRLATRLGQVAVAIGVVILVVGIVAGREPLDMFMTALALAVAMVPEGLPAVVTITLALGASAMLRQKALVRRLQAVETLGAASVICTDKTGTLTENAMTAADVWLAGRWYDVTGTGYDPAGHIARDGKRVRAKDDPDLDDLLAVAVTCGHASLEHKSDAWKMVGDPTEGALVTLAYKGWMPIPAPESILAETPFESDRKRMSVVAERDGVNVLMVKGAPEAVLSISDRVRGTDGPRALTPDDRAQIEEIYAQMAANGQRVLALAHRRDVGEDADEAALEFLGLVGLIDPPRAEVPEAVRLCQSAGIRIVMITGDAPRTAEAIAHEIGLPVEGFLTGVDVDALDDAALAEALTRDVHFARTTPAHKLRLVSALQSQAHLVAMTGDGVNDAPALKRADIGVAMGQRGTDVAKDASDLVLLDDNFATIVRAVREGRRQFANIQKFVRYLLASNAGEVVAIVANIFLGGPLIFLATQILWMNLVTDGATAVALGLEKSAPDVMEQKPRKKNGPILDLKGLGLILCFGLYTGAASLWLFYSVLEQDPELARTLAFTAMVVFEKASVFAFRSLHLPNGVIGWFTNRVLLIAFTLTLSAQVLAVYWTPLQTLLRTVPLDLSHWTTIILLALPLIVVPEIVKFVTYRQKATAAV